MMNTAAWTRWRSGLLVLLLLAIPLAVGKMFLELEVAQFLRLPSLSPSMVTLIGISHAGYLMAKVLPRSKPA